jgi:hypothetical protein
LLEKHGLEDRYRTQLPAAASSLDQAGHPAVSLAISPMAVKQAEGKSVPPEA